MATKPFKYQEMFPMGKDSTEYYLLTKDYVSVENFDGKEVLKVEPEALTRLANTAMRDVSFLLRREHNEMVARILHDPDHVAECRSSLQGSTSFLSRYRNSHRHG